MPRSNLENKPPKQTQRVPKWPLKWLLKLLPIKPSELYQQILIKWQKYLNFSALGTIYIDAMKQYQTMRKCGKVQNSCHTFLLLQAIKKLFQRLRGKTCFKRGLMLMHSNVGISKEALIIFTLKIVPLELRLNCNVFIFSLPCMMKSFDTFVGTPLGS